MKNANNKGGKSKLLLLTNDEESKLLNKALEDKFNEFIDLIIQVDLHEGQAASYLHRLHNLLKNEIKSTDSERIQNAQFLTAERSHTSIFKPLLLIKLIRLSIGILLITIGLTLIVIPAPSPSFEIATIYYFNPQDGVTVMDLLSLLILFCGIFVLVRTIIKKSSNIPG